MSTTTGTISIVPTTNQQPTINITSNGTGTTTGPTFGTGTLVYNNSTLQSLNNTLSSASLKITDYAIAQENEQLVIRDNHGRECLAIKNGTLMIGNQTIHELILDIVDMVNGTKPFTELLVDPDQSKRELGKQIYKRHRRLKRKREKA